MTSDDGLADDGLADDDGADEGLVDDGRPIRVAVLGPVRAWRGETELELGAPQRRAVLGLLAARANQAVSRDELIDGIWGDELPARSVNALHVHISRLRAALEPDRAPDVGAGAPGQRPRVPLRLAPAGSTPSCSPDGWPPRRPAGRVTAAAAASLESTLRLWQGVTLDGVPGPWQKIVRPGPASTADRRRGAR